MATAYRTLVLNSLQCCYEKCGVWFALDSVYEERRRKDKKSFVCPNGHKQGFYGKSAVEKENDKLRQDLEDERRRVIRERNWRETAEREATAAKRRASAARGQVTKMKNRMAHGICPVPGCKRSGFTSVQGHIASKHPGWKLPEEQ